ncbi:hypothetical protein NEF87_004442 [Candidatus Lokiarchaeum ossiferum]|uniref:Uncharacterized protein n=1 Tax=Candidatus Lokiarchaeum ossiferum TaxID=2951803 RepID=A0ABY6I0P6_9ARCH|nr:hypothetical protein NEF87_004442 [Candidatus Lokiarchaeum sp. B-35]
MKKQKIVKQLLFALVLFLCIFNNYSLSYQNLIKADIEPCSSSLEIGDYWKSVVITKAEGYNFSSTYNYKIVNFTSIEDLWGNTHECYVKVSNFSSNFSYDEFDVIIEGYSKEFFNISNNLMVRNAYFSNQTIFNNETHAIHSFLIQNVTHNFKRNISFNPFQLLSPGRSLVVNETYISNGTIAMNGPANEVSSLPISILRNYTMVGYDEFIIGNSPLNVSVFQIEQTMADLMSFNVTVFYSHQLGIELKSVLKQVEIDGTYNVETENIVIDINTRSFADLLTDNSTSSTATGTETTTSGTSTETSIETSNETQTGSESSNSEGFSINGYSSILIYGLGLMVAVQFSRIVKKKKARVVNPAF